MNGDLESPYKAYSETKVSKPEDYLYGTFPQSNHFIRQYPLFRMHDLLGYLQLLPSTHNHGHPHRHKISIKQYYVTLVVKRIVLLMATVLGMVEQHLCGTRIRDNYIFRSSFKERGPHTVSLPPGDLRATISTGRYKLPAPNTTVPHHHNTYRSSHITLFIL